ncbi:uncharacterized protein LOC109075707 isoform X5 [Cyprinus carpio]|uniref:Uncharacterized protein LOC109075707 isoform X5 n=1 Tax=Cyprinus carpio TaxID=7962 RepID=A0A9Q9YUA3_CYPCA|nr:uncharacterized protein LOC109075707 isoform X5 [Cyprinus carpio]
MANLVSLDLKEARVCQDQKEIRVIKETPGQGVMALMQVCIVIRFSLRVIKDKLAHLDLQALLEHPVQEDPQETQGRMVPAAHLENQVLLDKKEWREKAVYQENRVKLVIRVTQDHRDPQGQRVSRESQVLRVTEEPMVCQA